MSILPSRGRPRAGIAAALAAVMIAGAAFAQSTSPEAPPRARQPVVTGPFVADGAPGSFAHEFARRLYHVSLPAARDYAAANIAKEGQTARFAHGTALFVGAVEGLVADLTRFGLMNHEAVDLPFLRLPVPPNTTPDNIDYQKFRAMLQRFVDGLAKARGALDGITDPKVRLPLRVSLIRLDINGDGKYAEYERLGPFMQVIATGGSRGQAAWVEIEKGAKAYVDALARGDAKALKQLVRRDPAFGFDAADAVWLKGYTHLLSAIVEVLLAHDLKASFDASFHVFFPRAGLPGAELATRTTSKGQSFLGSSREMGQIMDMVAFLVHSPWTPTEPERLKAARLHLKGMVATSRQTWKMIAAETDNTSDAALSFPEWIPGPKQAQFRGRRVNQQIVDGWLRFLDTFDQLLDGKLLIGHWRFDQGMNLRKMFEEPRSFSPFLLVQGSHALPFLQDGPLADSQHMDRVLRVFRGDFLAYFVWFN